MGSRLMAIALLFLVSASVSALEVYMNADGVHLRVADFKNNMAYNYDYLSREQSLKNRTFYLPRGAKLNIPDMYVIKGADGKPDIQKSVARWYEEEKSAVRELRHNDNGSVAKSNLGSDEKGNFMAVSTHGLNEMNPNMDLPKKYPTAYVDFQSLVKYNSKALSLTPVEAASAGPAVSRPTISGPTMSQKISAIQFRPEDLAAQKIVSSPTVRTESVPQPEVQSTKASNSDLSLMCVIQGVNQCENVHYDLQTLKKDHFTSEFCRKGHCDTQKRVKAFAEYMAPIAQYFQAKTGLPASVMIAQAMIETYYGTSYLFNNKEALFGESCMKYGTQKSRSYNIENVSYNTKGACNSLRPKNEGGYYVTFDSKESSVASYIHNVLYDHSTRNIYGGVRQAVKEARAQDPTAVASWQKVVPHLKRYAVDSSYVGKISSTIRNLRLEQYDKNSCQNCIQQRENNKRTSNNEKATS